MDSSAQMLAILKKQERDREQAKRIAGIIGLAIIAPIMAFTLGAMMTVASVDPHASQEAAENR